MTKHVKIVLRGSRDIPFNQLVLSQANVRRVKAGVSIDALATDIARRGLLQSLTVRAQRDAEGNETGLFEVPAGGRRFRALEKLVKQRRMAKTEPVPCIVRDDDQISAEEDSLAENVHREALHPLDQFRAMQQLVTQGIDVETIAATFMVTSAVVKQRLRLASVSPKLHDIYAEDGMTLEQLMAFSVSEDHERQEQVWDMLQSSYNQQPYMIRSKLTEQSVRATDKRVRFVGLDAYVAAGGYVLRDLFEDDQGGWLQDVALLDRMVDEKLKAEGARVGEEGWKWVAVAVDFPYDYDDDMRIIDGDQPEMTEADEARLAALREEAEALEAEWSGAADVPDEIDTRVNAIDEEISAIVSRPLVYQPPEMARAGVFVSIDSDGSLYVERGYVRPEDEPAVELGEGAEQDGQLPADHERETEDGEAGPAIVTIGGAPGVVDPGEEDEQDDLLRPLPDRLVTELTTHRTLALRDAVASHPQVAFAAVLHALALDTFYHYSSGTSCVEISVRGGSLGTHAPGMGDSASARAIDQRHESWAERLPDQPQDLWDVLIALNAEDQAALFAHCASFGINAVWEPANRYNEGRVSARTVSGRIEHSHVLGRAADLDMVAAGWTATVDNYLGRVTKARILSAVDEAKGAEVAARLSGLKKPEMAKEAERLLADSGWLAEPLRTTALEPVEEPAAIDGELVVEPAAAQEHDGLEDEGRLLSRPNSSGALWGLSDRQAPYFLETLMASIASEISQRLADNAEAVCRRYLSKGRKEGRYWLVGDVHNTPGRSLYVRLSASSDGRGAAGKWTDAQNGDHGDLLDIITAARSCRTMRETLDEARRFLSMPIPPATEDPPPRRTKAPTGTPEPARRLRAASKPIPHSLVATYLASRHITDLTGCDALGYHPRCWYRASEDDDLDVLPAWPAMIAAVTDLQGTITGVHRTWLALDGSDKAPVAYPRRAMGHLLGHGVRFGQSGRVMLAGEGIETTLSLRQVMPSAGTIAGLSAAHLAAILFPAGLQRLYVARDDDPAGTGALATLTERATATGIEIVPLEPRLDDFNSDLRAFGREGLAANLRAQLRSDDAQLYLKTR